MDFNAMTPSFGAEVTGIDLSAPLSNSLRQEILDAWDQWGVLVFRDQRLTLDSQRGFTEQFGELFVHPAPHREPPAGFPEAIELYADEHSKSIAGEAWHSDVSAAEQPPMGSVLHMVEVPQAGGDTLFADMESVLKDISEPMRQMLVGMTATHSAESVYEGRYNDGRTSPVAHHPVIRVHPRTGRHVLFVNAGFTTQIDGLATDESEALLRMLWERVHNPKHQMRLRWRPGTVAMWDNCRVQHFAVGDYYPAVRRGYRFTLAGDRPSGVAAATDHAA